MSGDTLTRLNEFILNATAPYRKGAEVTRTKVGSVDVWEINGYPQAPSRGELVDVHFLQIGFTEYVADKDTFLELLKTAVRDGCGEFDPITPELLASGPSYITLGRVFGSQDIALRYIALGEHYGLWRAITPARLHMSDEMADVAAGNGLVMPSPFKLDD